MSSKRTLEDESVEQELKEDTSVAIKRLKTENVQSHEDHDSQHTLIIEDDECFQQKPDERCMLHIGDELYVVAKTYNNQLQIHIRQFHKYDKDVYPTKKGVTLSLCRWRLLESFKNIDKYFENYYSDTTTEDGEEESLHLGGGIYATMNHEYPVVNLRHWWKPKDSDKPMPTKRGVMINKAKWVQLTNSMSVMRDFVPELNDVSIGCIEDHANQIGMLQCAECNPFDCGQY